jgi:multimeric flavodoxin WrbA
MHRIYADLGDTDMLVLASPIYYHGISGQLKCAIDRFYSALYPEAPESLKYVSMFLASGDTDQYTGARFSFEGDFLGYLGLEDKGFFTSAGEMQEETLDEIRRMAKDL